MIRRPSENLRSQRSAQLQGIEKPYVGDDVRDQSGANHLIFRRVLVQGREPKT